MGRITGGRGSADDLGDFIFESVGDNAREGGLSQSLGFSTRILLVRGWAYEVKELDMARLRIASAGTTQWGFRLTEVRGGY